MCVFYDVLFTEKRFQKMKKKPDQEEENEKQERESKLSLVEVCPVILK